MLIREATLDDVRAVSGFEHVPSVKAWAGEVDGRVVGVAGFAFYKGRWIGFCDLLPEARKYKMTLARGAIRAMKSAKESGIRFVYAEASTDEPGAVRWMTSLGFEKDPRKPAIYRWKS